MSTIYATGSFVPRKRESNQSLEQRFSLEPGWIEKRTGVRSRAIADPNDAVSDLAIKAGRQALEKFVASTELGEEIGTQYPPAKISTLILATSTPNHLLPPTAPQVANELGLENVAAFDLTVACCGFLYALILADSLVQTTDQSVLIVAANILSRRCRENDRKTRPIFADAAGAVVLSPSFCMNTDPAENTASSFFSNWQSDGRFWEDLIIPDGGSRQPIQADSFANERHLMQLNDGSSLFRYAVEAMAESGKNVVQAAGLAIQEIDWWIPHQANIRIIEAARRALQIEPDKTLTTIQEFGNSSAATIPVTLDHFLNQDPGPGIQPGDRILMTAAAAGMTSAAVLLTMPQVRDC